MIKLTNRDFDKAKSHFDKFYQELLDKVNEEEILYKEPSNIKISTITLTGKIGDYVMGKYLYDRLPINDDIIYTENGKDYKGNKTKKTIKYSKKEKVEKLDKRKLGRGKPLSNQISIGMKGIMKGYKNPICFKIFKNGNLHITGCKNIEEARKLYERIYNYVEALPKKLYYKEEDTYFNIEPIKNIIHPDKLKLKTEMINATFHLNFEVAQLKLNNLLREKVSDDDLFVSYDSCVSSPAVRCYLKKLSKYDKRKKKKKQPSIFIYRSGSCNIIVWEMDLLKQSYDFINEFIKGNFDEIVSKDVLKYLK